MPSPVSQQWLLGLLILEILKNFLLYKTLEKKPGVEQGERQVYTQKLRRANQHMLAKVGISAHPTGHISWSVLSVSPRLARACAEV